MFVRNVALGLCAIDFVYRDKIWVLNGFEHPYLVVAKGLKASNIDDVKRYSPPFSHDNGTVVAQVQRINGLVSIPWKTGLDWNALKHTFAVSAGFDSPQRLDAGRLASVTLRA